MLNPRGLTAFVPTSGTGNYWILLVVSKFFAISQLIAIANCSFSPIRIGEWVVIYSAQCMNGIIYIWYRLHYKTIGFSTLLKNKVKNTSIYLIILLLVFFKFQLNWISDFPKLSSVLTTVIHWEYVCCLVEWVRVICIGLRIFAGRELL